MHMHTYQAVLQQRLIALDTSHFCLASPFSKHICVELVIANDRT